MFTFHINEKSQKVTNGLYALSTSFRKMNNEELTNIYLNHLVLFIQWKKKKCTLKIRNQIDRFSLSSIYKTLIFRHPFCIVCIWISNNRNYNCFIFDTDTCISGSSFIHEYQFVTVCDDSSVDEIFRDFTRFSSQSEKGRSYQMAFLETRYNAISTTIRFSNLLCHYKISKMH